MTTRKRSLMALEDRGPLRVLFLTTSMPVGGAETLLVSLVRRLNRDRFTPLVGCMKSLGPLGEMLAGEIPVYHSLIKHKYDLGVVRRLARLLTTERVDALVTVGAGDKMFWGRWAAHRAEVPVVLSALHSTGWPDSIGRLNGSRLLTRWTDGFIGVAQAHGAFLREVARFPPQKVFVIPNGVDTSRFSPLLDGSLLRSELGLRRTVPVAGIVAALRPEKDHELFLRAAAEVRRQVPEARFLIVGDGPERVRLEGIANRLHLEGSVRFLGTRDDIPEVLAALDVFVLTSKIEANPVSILEAMACGKPVIAPRVGSIEESVDDGQSGFLTEAGNLPQVVDRLTELLSDPARARRMGRAGRDIVVDHWSLQRMVEGYEELIAQLYLRKYRMARNQRGNPVVSNQAPWRATTLP